MGAMEGLDIFFGADSEGDAVYFVQQLSGGAGANRDALMGAGWVTGSNEEGDWQQSSAAGSWGPDMSTVRAVHVAHISLTPCVESARVSTR